MSNIQKYITESGDIYYLSELERFAEIQGVDIDFFMQKMEEQGMKEYEPPQKEIQATPVNSMASRFGDLAESPFVRKLLGAAIPGGAPVRQAFEFAVGGDTASETLQTAQNYGIVTGGAAIQAKNDPIGALSTLYNDGLKRGGSKFVDTAAEVTFDNTKDIEESVATSLLFLGGNVGEDKASARAIAKSMIAAKDAAFNTGLGKFIESLLPEPAKLLTTSRKEIEEFRDPLKKYIKEYDTTITESLIGAKNGEQTDFVELGSRIFSDAVGSMPYTIMSLNPYTAAYMGAGIAGDKFLEELEEDPERTLFQLSGNALFTGGIEVADAYLTRRFLRSGGYLSDGMSKKATEEAVKQMNKGISGKILDIYGIAGKEGLTEIAQAVATRINDKVWFEYDDIIEKGLDADFGIMRDAYSIIDEGIIGAFSGGKITAVAAATQTKSRLTDRVEQLLMPSHVRKQRQDLVNEYLERDNLIKEAKKEGNNKRAAALLGINRKVLANIREISNRNRLVLNNLEGNDLLEYARNIDSINQLKDGKQNNAVDKEIDNLNKQNSDIFDKIIKEKYGSNVDFAKVSAKQLGLKLRIAKTNQSFNNIIKKLTGRVIKDSNGVNGAFIGNGVMVINEKVALKQGAVTVGSHEILHPILNAMVGDVQAQETIVKDFQKTMTSAQKKWTDLEIKRKGIQEGTRQYYTEYINVFSEGIINNEINFDLNFSEQIKEWVTKLFKSKGFNNIDFRSGRGVYNFMKAYKESADKGKLNQDVLGALDIEAIKEVDVVGKNIQKSEEVQKIYDEKGVDGAFEILEKYTPMAKKLAARFQNVPGYTTLSDILTDEILTGKRGILDLIYDYSPSKGVPLAAYINKFIKSRSIEAANRILDTKFKLDVTELTGVTDTQTQEEVEESQTKEETQRNSLRISLSLTNDVINKVKDAVIKTFGTRLPDVTSKKFKKALTDNYKTFLKPTIAKMLGRQESYRDFLNENFKLIYDILPQSVINKRFSQFAEPVLDENGKQLRERTPEGNKIFKKRKITRKEFVDYFLGENVGRSTQGTRKTALAEALANEIAFDATLDVLRSPEIFEKVKQIGAAQEINIADNYLAQVAQKIDRGVDFQFSREATNAADLYAIRDAIVDGSLKESFPDVYEQIFTGVKSFGLIPPKGFMGVSFETYIKSTVNNRNNLFVKVIGDGKMGPSGTDLIFEIANDTKGKIAVKTEVKTDITDMFGSGGVKMDSQGEFSTTNSLIDVMLPLVKEKIDIYKKLHKRAEEIQGEKIPFKFPQTGYLKETWDKIKGEFRAAERNIELIFDNVHLIEKFYNAKDIFYIYIGNKGLFYLGKNKNNLNAKRLESKSKMYMSLRSSGTRKDGTVYLTLRAFNGLVDGENIQQDILVTEENFEDHYFQFSKETGNLDLEFNQILEDKFDIDSKKRYSRIEARRAGRGKGGPKIILPYEAEDFKGLMYNLLPKGEKGNKAMAWIEQNLFNTFNSGIENINKDRMQLMNRFKELKSKIKSVPAKISKNIPSGKETYETAIRVYIWDTQGMDIPGLTNSERKEMVDLVKNDKDLLEFATELIALNGDVGYVKPSAAWDAGTITTDLMQNLNEGIRAKHLEKWQDNVDEIFSEENLNKIEAAKGPEYVDVLKRTLARMKSGRNRFNSGSKAVDNLLDWLNNSVGVIMFLNVRSAVLQTISTVNYINWSDNNPLKAGVAYANQPQYWKDFTYLWNSDYLKERRGGLQINVSESEIADMAKKNGVKGAISYLLNKGFVLTRTADSWAIANGGATFYRNRINSYKKQGLSEKEAEEKAFLDFRELTEESQQSSRPDKISEQQASGAGRVILAFANTPMQYTRLMKRASQDLLAGRGDWKTNLSKLTYYGFIQNFMFNAMQQALFALGFSDEEDDKTQQKYTNTINGMLDSVLRGAGYYGAGVSVIKNYVADLVRRKELPRPNYRDATWKLLDISPPLDAKISKIYQAGTIVDFEMDNIKSQPFNLQNPAADVIGKTTSAFTNVPLDRVLRLYNNTRYAIVSDAEYWQKVALALGWTKWQLGIEETDTIQTIRPRTKRRKKVKRKTTQ